MSDTGINAAMMAEENDAAEAVRPHSHAAIKPGVQLAQQRELLGWSVEQVAEQLKLAPRQVTALEADDYAALPGLAVVRGFIRAYAKILKIDASPLVSMIEVETVAPKEPMPLRSDLSSKFSNSGMPLMGKRGTPVTWVVAAVVGVLAVVLGSQQMGWLPPASTWLKTPAAAPAASANAASAELTVAGVDPVPVSVPAPETAPVTAGMAVADEHDMKAAAPAAVTPAPVAPAPVLPTPAARAGEAVLPRIDATVPGLADAKRAAPATPAPLAAPAAATTVTKTAAPANATTPANNGTANSANNANAAGPTTGSLVFSAHQDTWVEVKRANGTILISRVIKAGTTETVALDSAVVLVVGNVAGVDATLRGTPLNLKSPTGGNTARLNLK